MWSFEPHPSNAKSEPLQIPPHRQYWHRSAAARLRGNTQGIMFGVPAPALSHVALAWQLRLAHVVWRFDKPPVSDAPAAASAFAADTGVPQVVVVAAAAAAALSRLRKKCRSAKACSSAWLSVYVVRLDLYLPSSFAMGAMRSDTGIDVRRARCFFHRVMSSSLRFSKRFALTTSARILAVFSSRRPRARACEPRQGTLRSNLQRARPTASSTLQPSHAT